MLRTIIIDYEAHNRDTLRKLLTRHCPQVQVVGEASGVADGVNAISQIHNFTSHSKRSETPGNFLS